MLRPALEKWPQSEAVPVKFASGPDSRQLRAAARLESGESCRAALQGR